MLTDPYGSRACLPDFGKIPINRLTTASICLIIVYYMFIDCKRLQGCRVRCASNHLIVSVYRVPQMQGVGRASIFFTYSDQIKAYAVPWERLLSFYRLCQLAQRQSGASDNRRLCRPSKSRHGGSLCHLLSSLKSAMGAKVGTRLHACTFVQMTSWSWTPTK
jgi:hypothetical protein